MNQKQYHWRRYTRPLIVLLMLMLVPAYLILFGPVAMIIYALAGLFLSIGIWFYVEEIHPYKNSIWTEPLTWSEVQRAEGYKQENIND